MSPIDWWVLGLAVVGIVVYGLWKGRDSGTTEGYLLAGRSLPWYAVALSIMATQASAVTFLSAPGQTYVDGMRYVQVYLGLPIAMVILSVVVLPIYNRLKVYTAYEFLENRFDLKTRTLAAMLFLLQRGLAAGLTIFAPAIVLSALLGWSLTFTNLLVGVAVIIYTTIGGSKAVSWTQFHQMIVITLGMLAAFFMVLKLLPEGVGLAEATRVAGSMGRLNAIDWNFDITNRYNIWSGVIGGCFLQMSYFGTDQSQVQRYLAGRSLGQSRRGMLFNGLMKIPMQFFIFFLGAMVFVFYQFEQPPVFFNQVVLEEARESSIGEELKLHEAEFAAAFVVKKTEVESLVGALGTDGEEAARQRVEVADARLSEIRTDAIGVMQEADPSLDPQDTNFIFLSFVIGYLPAGLVGLLIAAILFASMSSTSSELNALATTSVVDVYQRWVKPDASDLHYLWVSKVATALWGLWAIAFAQYASRLGSLIEAVNILGSLFYGTILGIFLLAFWVKRVSGTATFIAAVITEICVLLLAYFPPIEVAWLWWNVIGCLLCMGLAVLIQPFVGGGRSVAPA